MSSTLSLWNTFGAVLVVGLATYIVSWQVEKRRLPLPPGPKKLPFIGNLLQLPKSSNWVTYDRWSRELGSDIIHLSAAGASIVVLSSEAAVEELFEKRSTIYSSRPESAMLMLMGWKSNLVFMPYGEYWRVHRRLFHQEFNMAAAARFKPQELKVARQFLQRLLDKPEEFISHIRHMTGSAILSIVYGIDALEEKDPYLEVVDRSVHIGATEGAFGKYLVDYLPSLKHIPNWFPGANFKRKAKEWSKVTQEMIDKPFEATKKNIAQGVQHPSFSSNRLADLDESQDVAEQELYIKQTAGAMYSAGSDTTASAITNLFLAMLTSPESQRKAQEEIDRVVKPGFLPDFSDEASLPYVTAVVKEILRWKPISPLAIPHYLMVDDVYKGYRIPAGSAVFSNLWSLTRDENVYSDPDTFDPDRFIMDGQLNPAVKDPVDIIFGMGRRICPGMYMAYSSIWISVVSILAVFDITKATAPDGSFIEPSHEHETGILAVPLPFKCSIKPRSRQAIDLIHSLDY